MKSILPHLATFAFVLSAPLAAQSIWTVDATGFGNFTDLGMALRVARAGDTVIIQSGLYGGGSIRTGLQLIGLPGAVIGDDLEIRAVPAGLPVRIAGISFGNNPDMSHRDPGGPIPGLWIDQCRASVHLESSSIGWVAVNDSHVATLNHCDLNQGLSATRSTVLATSCDLEGIRAGDHGFYRVFYPSSPGVDAIDATVRLTNCTVRGGDGWAGSPASPPSPAVRIDGGELSVTGDTRNQAVPGTILGGPAITAFDNTDGVVEYDPRTGVSGFSSQGSAVYRSIDRDAVVVQSAAPGGTMTVELIGEPTATAIVGFSYSGSPMMIPPLGELWLNQSSIAMLPTVTVPLTGSWSTTIALPNWLPRGMELVFQGGLLRSNGPRLTSACVAVIR